MNLLPHLGDFLHVLFNLNFILPDDLVLDFKSVEKVLFDHCELQVFLTFENFQDHERRDDLLLALVLLEVYNEVQSIFDHYLIAWQISEVG